MTDLLVDAAYVGRTRPDARVLAAIGLIAALLWSGAASAEPTLQGCRALPLVDQEGAEVIGVEDVALDPRHGRLLLSAHDRRARSPVPGGVFAWPIADIARGEPRVRRLAVADLPAGGLRPHGIGIDGDRLAVVNRTTDPQGTTRPVVDLFEVDEGGLRHRERRENPRLCRPNDVAFARDRLLVTNDRGHCSGPGFWLERLFNRPEAFVMALGDGRAEIVARRLRFANGIALAHGDIVVAATRGRRLHRRDGPPVDLPFAPDNVTTADGAFWVAGPVHLWRFAAFINGLAASAGPSAVARVTASNQLSVFALPSGLSEGATAAMPVGDRLVVVAGWDDRVALCDNPFAPARAAGAVSRP